MTLSSKRQVSHPVGHVTHWPDPSLYLPESHVVQLKRVLQTEHPSKQSSNVIEAFQLFPQTASRLTVSKPT